MPSDESEEQQLIDRAKEGDGDAFTELFHRYYTMIYAFAYRLCFDKADAQDVAQETFVKAARSLASFRQESSFKQWLYRIALNCGHDRNRSHGRRNRLAEAVGDDTPERSSKDFTELHEALENLPEDWRQAVTLVFFEGMSHAEAGRVMRCAEATVSWKIFMAKRKMKGLLVQG